MKDGWKAKETFDPSGNAAAAPLARNLEDLLSWPEETEAILCSSVASASAASRACLLAAFKE